MVPPVVWFWIYGHMTCTRLAVLIIEVFHSPWTSWHLSPQKDSHTLYLEQELESLKVVLDIKNKQLHQQEKKMIELDKLVRPGANESDCWASRQAMLNMIFFFLNSTLLIYFSFQKDKNVKLDESLKKVQQENEDLKARMDRHAALSR